MSGIYEFITVFCSFSLLFGGIYILKPNGKTEKTVKYVFSLIFICVILTAILGIKTDDFTLKKNNTDYEISTEALANQTARLTFAKALESLDIKFSKITVCTNKNTDGSISISKVTVYSNEPKEKITEALKNSNSQYEIEVCYE